MAAALAEAAVPTEAAAPAAKSAAPAPARPMPACKNCGRRAETGAPSGATHVISHDGRRV
eukprot:7056010-Prymnesium_polylepis.1